MNNFVVLTLIADDRPGIVGKIAQVVAANGGNWLESSMSRLAGKFAGLLLVEVPGGDRQALINAMAALEAEGISVSLAASPNTQESTGERLVLTVVGNDRPGIVSEISSLLAQRNINVEQLTTSCESAPMSAEPLFKARAKIQLPADLDQEKLQRSLEALSADLMVEIEDQ